MSPIPWLALGLAGCLPRLSNTLWKGPPDPVDSGTPTLPERR